MSDSEEIEYEEWECSREYAPYGTNRGPWEDSRGEYRDQHEDFKTKWPFGGKGFPSDVPVPTGASCLQVNKLLAQADKASGEFTFGGQADTLPVAPGLFVDGVGAIPVPLTEEVAQKLIAVCEQSPFGRNLETLVDEDVRKSWQLEATQWSFKNPLWQKGVEELGKTIAERLGYPDVPLQCVPYKLLVYAEGGHFTKHKDTEKEDGMIATLVVQPPSLHEGGDLLVYRNSETSYRHAFGKPDGTAAFLPHYAVHYADAEHSLETVTKGYRLALVYSICLPPTMRHIRKDHDNLLCEELAGAISNMNNGDDSFALLLSHQYTEKSVKSMGVGALKGIDRARFNALKEANKLVSKDKQLFFFLAQLSHEVDLYGDEVTEEKESITWYSVSGERVGCVHQPAVKFNFLNPGQETLSRIWRPYGSSTYEGNLGNESGTRDTIYSRYALAAWPLANAVEVALKFISVGAAVEALCRAFDIAANELGAGTTTTTTGHSTDPRSLIDAAELSNAMDALLKKYVRWIKVTKKRGIAQKQGSEDPHHSVAFYRGLSELVVRTGDVALVKRFFREFWAGFDPEMDESELVPSLILITNTFDWSDIGPAILSSVDKNNDPVGLTLQVSDGLEGGPARKDLVNAAVDKAVKLNDAMLCSSKWLDLLWKLAINSDDKAVFESLVDRFKQAQPELLGAVVKALSTNLGGLDDTDTKISLGAIAKKRSDWLNEEVRRLDKPFSWEMPKATFPKNAEVEAFLRGRDDSLKITSGEKPFKSLQDATNFAALWNREEKSNASFIMEADSNNDNTFVTITKTREWFDQQQAKLQQCKLELQTLTEKFGRSRKRSHEELETKAEEE